MHATAREAGGARNGRKSNVTEAGHPLFPFVRACHGRLGVICVPSGWLCIIIAPLGAPFGPKNMAAAALLFIIAAHALTVPPCGPSGTPEGVASKSVRPWKTMPSILTVHPIEDDSPTTVPLEEEQIMDSAATPARATDPMMSVQAALTDEEFYEGADELLNMPLVLIDDVLRSGTVQMMKWMEALSPKQFVAVDLIWVATCFTLTGTLCMALARAYSEWQYAFPAVDSCAAVYCVSSPWW